MKRWQFEEIEDAKKFRRDMRDLVACIEAQQTLILNKLDAMEADRESMALLTKKLDAAGNELAASVEAATPQS